MSMAQRDEDEEIDIVQRKRELDVELKDRLYVEISPDWDGYERFLLRARRHLSKVKTARCKDSIIAVFDALEGKGIISPGHYAALRELLVDLNEPAVDIIDEYVEKFEQLRKLKGKGKTLKRKEDSQGNVPQKKVKYKDTEFMNEELKQSIDITRILIDEHASDTTFIKTKAVECGQEVLERDNIVIFSGKSGTGKTKNALEILRWFRNEWDINNEYTIIKLPSFCKWNDLVDVTSNTVVFLDNLLNEVYGISTVDVVADIIWSSISVGNIKLIATIQNIDYSLNKRKLEKYKLFKTDHIVDLSAEAHELSIKEKIEILQSHLKQNNLKLPNPLQEKQIISSDNPLNDFCEQTILENYASSPLLSEGYPLTCYLFCNEHFHIGYDFFLHPNKYIIDDYHKLSESTDDIENTKYCLLVLVMLNRQKIVNHLNSILEKVKDIASCLSFKDQTLPRLSTAISSLRKNVLTLSHNSFLDFQNEYIYKALCISYGRYFPDKILKACSSKFFFELIRTENSSDESEKERMLIIPPIAFKDASSRVLDELSHGNLLELATHPIMRDEMFVDDFFERQKSDPNFLEALVKQCIPYVLMFDEKFYTVDNFFNISCIYGYLSLVKYLLEFSLEFTSGFRLACARGYVEIASAIVEKYDWPSNDVMMSVCFDACSVGNMNTVHFLKTRDENLFFRNDEKIGIPIVQAVKNKHKEIVESLLQRQVKINAKCCKTIYEYCLKNNWAGICDFMKNMYKISFGKAEHKMVNSKATAKNEADTDISSISVGEVEKKLLYSHKIKNKMNNHLDKKRGPSVIRFLAQNGMEFKMKQLVKFNLEFLIESDVLNEKDADGMTPLLVAADKKYPSIVKELLKIVTVDINVTANDGDTILHYCARYNWSDITHFLTKHRDFDRILNTKGFNGQTPIIVAASNASEGVINILLKQQNIDLSVQDDENDTFLHKCAWNGLTVVFKKHVSQTNTDDSISSLLTVKGKNGYTVIMCAAIRKHKVITKFLLKKLNTNITVIDHDENNLLFYCHLNDWTDLIGLVIQSLYMKKSLKQYKFKFYETENQRWKMANKRKYVICFSFAEKQAHIELSITSPSHADIVLCHTDKGWNDTFDNIFLQNCGWQHIPVTKIKDNTAILLNRVHTPRKIIQMLASSDIEKAINVEYSSLVSICANEGYKDVVEELTRSSEVDMKCVDNDGNNILHHCARAGWIDILQHILTTVLDIVDRDNILNKKGYNEQTVILIAADKGKKETVNYLMKNKEADMTCVAKDGNNILHYCAKQGWIDILQYILTKILDSADRGQMLNEKGYNEQTVILKAAANGHKELVEELKKYKEVDMTCVDKTGNNLHHYCLKNGWTDIIQNLLSITDKDEEQMEM